MKKSKKPKNFKTIDGVDLDADGILELLADEDLEELEQQEETRKAELLEERRRDQKIQDDRALANIRQLNSWREEDLKKAAKTKIDDFVDLKNANQRAAAEIGLLLTFAVGGVTGSADKLFIAPALNWGESALWYGEQLLCIRTYESPLNPVFMHIPPINPQPYVRMLIEQLNALSKAHVTVSERILSDFNILRRS